MTVTISVKTINIELAPDHVYPKRHTAAVTVDIAWGDKQTMQMNFTVNDYDDLAAAVEKVNDQIIIFADELRVAANQPMAGTRRN